MSRREAQILTLLKQGAVIWWPSGAKVAWVILGGQVLVHRVRISLLHHLEQCGLIEYEVGSNPEFPDTYVHLCK